MRERGKGKKGRARNATVTNMEEWEYDPERNETENEFSEGQWGVNYTGGGDDVSRDLDWGEIEKYGADSEVERFLQNNEDAHTGLRVFTNGNRCGRF